jgi:DNA-binding HxlR family transcriptional regulator
MTSSRLTDSFARSSCPVACSLDFIGDKWTLLVVRDLFSDKYTYSQLQKGREKIPTNILADRLKRLEYHGIITKELYQLRPKRYAYHLTNRGRDLGPVLLELVKWGSKHLRRPEVLQP